METDFIEQILKGKKFYCLLCKAYQSPQTSNEVTI